LPLLTTCQAHTLQ